MHGISNLHLDPADLHLQRVVALPLVVAASEGDLATAAPGKQCVVDRALDLGAGLSQAPSEGYMEPARIRRSRVQSGLVKDVKGSIGEFEKPWKLNV